jgi:hypothetical protein
MEKKTMPAGDKGKYMTAAILVAMVVLIYLWTFQARW